MAHLAISLLGSFHVTLDGRPVTAFQSDKGRGLLAYLAVEATAPQRRERLAGLLWPESSESQARHSLSQAFFNLRRITGDESAAPPFFLADHHAIQLNPASDHWLDVAAFSQLLKSPAIPLLEDGASLYRGPFLAGFSLPDSVLFEEWALLERERLHRQAVEALARLARLEEQAGAPEEALGHIRRLLALDPLAEEAHRRAMHLLAGLGRPGEALAQYEACRKLLDAELGAMPAPQTIRLAEQIRGSQEKSGFFGEAGLLVTPTPHNLPALATAFVGRQAELAAINGWLADRTCRLLTVVGMGGAGKTRLALRAAEAATRSACPFPDGAWLVSLAEVTAVAQAPHAILAALGVRPRDPPADIRQQLRSTLRRRRLLLLLDNAEHLVEDGLGDLVAEILAAAPGVKILATSRMRLGLQGEQTLALGGMTTPGPGELDPDRAHDFSALALFEQRARLARPGFALDRRTLADAAAICRLVEGLPLAIELAAAWLEAFSLPEIRAELAASLDFLHADLADLPARHRSLRAVCRSMWGLLAPAEQAGLTRLGLTRGGFTFEAAQRVAGVTADDMRGLLRKSVVQRLPAARYGIHEVVRQYALEQLHNDGRATNDAIRRYCIYFNDWLRQQGERMAGPQQKAAFDAVAADLENCRHAWLLAIEHGYLDLANQALDGLCKHLSVRGTRQNIIDLMQAGLDRLPPGQPAPPARSKLRRPGSGAGAAWTSALLQARLISYQVAQISWHSTAQLSRQALAQVEEFGLQDQMGVALSLLAAQVAISVDPVRGLQVLQENTERLRRQGHDCALATSLNSLGGVLRTYGTLAEARAAFTESAAICRRCGDQLLLAANLAALAEVAYFQHDVMAAQRGYQESYDLFKALDAPINATFCLGALADIACALGDFARGLALFRTAEALLAEAGDVYGVNYMRSCQSITAPRVGDLAEGRRLRTQMLAEAQEAGNLIEVFFANIELGEMSRIAGDLPEARRFLDAGCELLPQLQVSEPWLPLVYGNYYRIAGEIALDGADFAEASACFEQALPWWRRQDIAWGISYCAAGLGWAALALGKLDLAAGRLCEALAQSRRGNGDMNVLTRALSAAADWLAAQGRVEEALALAAQVATLPGTWETARRAAAQCEHLAAGLPPDVAGAARERGRSADLDIVVAGILGLLSPALAADTGYRV